MPQSFFVRNSVVETPAQLKAQAERICQMVGKARRNLGVLCDLYLADLECALSSYEAYMTTVPGDDQAAMWIADLRQRMGRQE